MSPETRKSSGRSRGFFEIGVAFPKTATNVGTLLRSATQLGANGAFTIGPRYSPQHSDTCKSWRHLPLREFGTVEEFLSAMPRDTWLVGVEMGGTPLHRFPHPERAVYVLGAEDYGLNKQIQEACRAIVSLESVRMNSYNVAVSGSLVMYDRVFGNGRKT